MNRETIINLYLIELEKVIGECLFYIGHDKTLIFIESLVQLDVPQDIFQPNLESLFLQHLFGFNNLQLFDKFTETFVGTAQFLGFPMTRQLLIKAGELDSKGPVN